LKIQRVNVLADRAAVVEAQAGIDRQSFTNSHAIGNKESGGLELTTHDRWIARDRLKRLAIVINVPNARWDAERLAVFALFDLCAYSYGVIAKQRPLVMVEDRFSGGAKKGQSTEASSLYDPGARFGKRKCSVSSVVRSLGPPISPGELTRICPLGMAAVLSPYIGATAPGQ
jgi:hypothetical protein